MRVSRLVPALALAAMCCSGAPAGAADTMMAAPDCATANATMMKMAAMQMPALSGADLDKNFMTAMHAMSDHSMKMAKLESACGKDAKAKQAAAKIEQDMAQVDKLLLGGP